MSEKPPKGAESAFPARWAWILVGLAGIHRLVLAWITAEPSSLWMGDARDYLEITEGLLRGTLSGAVWVWPPGYSLAGAALAWLGGAGAGLLAASALAGAAAPLILLWAARGTRAMRIAAPAAVILAVFPELTLAAGRPLSDAAGIALLVAAAAGAVAAARTGRPRWAVLGGVAAGLGVLTRPEQLLAVVPFALAPFAAMPRAAAARRAALYLLPVALLVGPYVIGLKQASGVWALSLKPQYNLTKIGIYREPIPYLEKRARWSVAHEEFRPGGGDWRPEAIAQAADPRAYLTSPGLPRQWLTNFLEGFRRATPEMTVLALLGAIGLCLPARGLAVERWIALAALLPFAPGPAFYSPFGRYLLPLVPGFAWGAAALLDFALRGLPAKRNAARAAAAAFCAVSVALAATVSPRSARDGRFDAMRT
ncbi:MAG TPA: glycosyltransferase family 39 protein, partial [bacterium]|nr:glycosyltransferase family 39 protein [bacterium]